MHSLTFFKVPKIGFMRAMGARGQEGGMGPREVQGPGVGGSARARTDSETPYLGCMGARGAQGPGGL